MNDKELVNKDIKTDILLKIINDRGRCKNDPFICKRYCSLYETCYTKENYFLEASREKKLTLAKKFLRNKII